MKGRCVRGAIVGLLACFLFVGPAAARQPGEVPQTGQDLGKSEGPQTPKLEFWTQTFVREHPILRLLTLPLLRDQKLKQFKVLSTRSFPPGRVRR